MKEIFDRFVDEIISMWRYRTTAVIALWLTCLLGWAIVIVMPDLYRATARVQVDTSPILEPVLGNQIVAANVDEQLSLVRQALLGSVQLLNVARETGLDQDINTEAERTEFINRLRDNISISTSNPISRSAGDRLFTIEYAHADRQMAVDVVTVLLNTFIEDTLNAERDSNLKARDFIESQIADNERRLREAEDRLAQFKKENADKLPGSEGGYFSRLQSLQDQLAQSRRDLRLAQSRRDRLLLQIADETAVVSASGGREQELPPNSIDAKIRDYEQRLESLLLDYTDRHPDVIAVRETLDRLKADREARLEQLGVGGSQAELVTLDANPIRQAIQISLNETEVEIATLQADIVEREKAVAKLQELIDDVPEVEAELARLNRDYEVINRGYQDLVESRETQELSSRVYDTAEGDFAVIDPPVADNRPVSPNRPILFVLVGLVASGIAAGLAFTLSQLTPVFNNTRALTNQTGLPVLGSVALIREYETGLLGRSDVKTVVLSVSMLGMIFVLILSLELFGGGIRDLLVSQF